MTKALLNLFAANPSKSAVRCDVAPDEEEATLWIYDAIGGWGILAADVARALAAAGKAKVLHLRINSPGGDVFEARAIATLLAQSPARVVAHVDGLAASAASFLMLSADEIEIAKGAMVMIHKPWGFCMGDEGEMNATGDLLRMVGTEICNDYCARTGLPTVDVAQMMADETWMTAEEAVALKFCDRIFEKQAKAAAMARVFDLSAYAKAPANATAPARDADAEMMALRSRMLARAKLFEIAA